MDDRSAALGPPRRPPPARAGDRLARGAPKNPVDRANALLAQMTREEKIAFAATAGGRSAPRHPGHRAERRAERDPGRRAGCDGVSRLP
jgi:hypothetical protein